jgi:hypothetical protein
MLQACPLAPDALGRIMELPVDTRQAASWPAVLRETRGREGRRRFPLIQATAPERDAALR